MSTIYEAIDVKVVTETAVRVYELTSGHSWACALAR